MHQSPCFLRGQYVLCDLCVLHEHYYSFNSIIRLEFESVRYFS